MNYYPLTIFALFLLLYVWLIIPEGKMIKPFPMDRSYSISAQFYWFYVGVFTIIFALSLIIAVQTDNQYAWIIAVLFFNFLIDYLLHYLQPYGYIKAFRFVKIKPTGFFIPVSYPMFMGLILLTLTIRSWK